MAKVKIKSNNSKDPNRKEKLLELLSENEIYATGITIAPDGFFIWTGDDSDLDRLFNSVTDRYLENNGFTPIIPPELKAIRSVIIFNVDNHIYNREEVEMIDEIMDKNAYTTTKITDLMKIPRTKMIKITFTKTDIARKATECGLRMFSMSLPPHQIVQDNYIELKSCMKCYKIEEHSTPDCPMPKEYRICSECAESGHTWKECTNPSKKCINCDGEHRTLAMKCPKRKEALKQKRRLAKERSTYSNVAKSTIYTKPPHIPEFPTISANALQLSYDCFMYAHIMNAGKPGTFQEELNKIRKANNLPTLIIPEDPPSELILGAMAKQSNTKFNTNEMETTGAGATATTSRTEEERMEEDRGEATKQNQSASFLHDSQRVHERKDYPHTADELGLTIYTKQSVGWPAKFEFTRQTLVKGIHEKKYKYTYTNKEIQEDELMKMIQNRTIHIPASNMSKVDSSTFAKIRNGLMEEKTPPPRQRKQSK